MIDLVFRAAQQQAGKVLRSPTTLRILSNPRVQKTMLQAINLRADLRQLVTLQVEGFARNHNLVTREDVAKLRRTIREMEGIIAQLRLDLDDASTQAETKKNDTEKKAKSTPRKARRTASRKSTTKKPTRTRNSEKKTTGKKAR